MIILELIIILLLLSNNATAHVFHNISVREFDSVSFTYGVIGILSADFPENTELRNAQRETWIRETNAYEDIHVKVFFLLDNESPNTLAEQEIYGDIVFLNATFKGRAVRFGEKMYKWLLYVNETYPDASFVGKMDDDAYPCTDSVWSFIKHRWSPQLYSGFHHGQQNKVDVVHRSDEMFLLLGMDLVHRIINRTYCYDLDKCDREVDIFDTDNIGSSVGLWLDHYNDINIVPLNNVAQHHTKEAKHPIIHDLCKNLILFHKATPCEMRLVFTSHLLYQKSLHHN